MKKPIAYLTGLVLLLPFKASDALGLSLQDFRKEVFRPNNLPIGETSNLSPETKVNTILNFLINLVLFASGSVAVLILVYGGIRFVTSGGNQEQREAAMKIIRWAITGLLVVILAYALVTNVMDLIYRATS